MPIAQIPKQYQDSVGMDLLGLAGPLSIPAQTGIGKTLAGYLLKLKNKRFEMMVNKAVKNGTAQWGAETG